MDKTKNMTSSEYSDYHYKPYREKRLAYQKNYYDEHHEEILRKKRERYWRRKNERNTKD